MTTHKENADFLANVIDSSLLDSSIDWIKTNLSPEDVFDEAKLHEWAENNGYTQIEKED